MSTFVLKKLEAVVGKQQFFELVVDGNSQFDEYCREVKDNKQYYSELLKIFTLMNQVSQLKMLPQTKFKDITPKKEAVKEYEFKSKHLRVYAFHMERTGKIVAYGGYKNAQKDDIPKFRSYKSRYLKNFQNDNPKRIN
jgi:putative component of toxin-antitoxin plasmid stabilization module